MPRIEMEIADDISPWADVLYLQEDEGRTVYIDHSGEEAEWSWLIIPQQTEGGHSEVMMRFDFKDGPTVIVRTSARAFLLASKGVMDTMPDLVRSLFL